MKKQKIISNKEVLNKKIFNLIKNTNKKRFNCKQTKSI